MKVGTKHKIFEVSIPFGREPGWKREKIEKINARAEKKVKKGKKLTKNEILARQAHMYYASNLKNIAKKHASKIR